MSTFNVALTLSSMPSFAFNILLLVLLSAITLIRACLCMASYFFFKRRIAQVKDQSGNLNETL